MDTKMATKFRDFAIQAAVVVVPIFGLATWYLPIILDCKQSLLGNGATGGGGGTRATVTIHDR